MHYLAVLSFLFMSRESPGEHINTLRGCDPSLVHRVPLLTPCYSSDMQSHKSVQCDTGVRWPSDPGLVLVDKLDAFPFKHSLPVLSCKQRRVEAQVNVAL